MTKISKSKFKKAIPGTGGVQAVIAQRLGVERSTITSYLQKNPKMKKMLDLEREKIIDMAENKLFKAAENGDKWAVDKILSTIGKDRGYTEKREVEYTGGAPAVFNLIEKSVEEIKHDKPGNQSKAEGNTESPGRQHSH